jgi:hypothetical protein
VGFWQPLQACCGLDSLLSSYFVFDGGKATVNARVVADRPESFMQPSMVVVRVVVHRNWRPVEDRVMYRHGAEPGPLYDGGGDFFYMRDYYAVVSTAWAACACVGCAVDALTWCSTDVVRRRQCMQDHTGARHAVNKRTCIKLQQGLNNLYISSTNLQSLQQISID